MEPLSDVEVAQARLVEAQERYAALVARMDRFKAEGISTVLYEQLLRTYETSLHLTQARVRSLTNDLISYRCYLMTGEHIRGVRILDAADDAAVLIKVGQLLKKHPEHPSIEVWDRKRLVARLTRS